MKVLCAHNWGIPTDGWDGEKTIRFHQCRWCHVVWFEGDVIPQVITGHLVEGIDKRTDRGLHS